MSTIINESSKPSCLVIGAGGVGVITTYSLFNAGLSEVSLVVRSDYEHVKQNGYSIESCDYGSISNWRPHHLFKTAHDAAQSGRFFDYIVVTVKNIPDGPKSGTVHEIVRPVVESNHQIDASRITSIMLIQNGLDIEKELLEHFDQNCYKLALLSGVQLIGSTKVGPGKVVQISADRLSVAPFDAVDEIAIERTKLFATMYNNEGHNEVKYENNVKYIRWRKLLYNAVINTTTALTQVDSARCQMLSRESNSTENCLWIPAMKEVIAIAASEGVTIDPKEMEFFLVLAKTFVYKPSMCIDYEKGQLMELEVILGNPLRIARKNGVSAPTLFVIYHLMTILQGKIKERQGIIRFNEKTIKVESVLE
ncbi:LAME_0B06480g1_1 [Lachancea meyersii CBS 8951]|uniref:LAME_0B06480g1_1 n=1 Tax=Lachancea meyersii CBS 8951 TaxID=1266667 RepID=A0A1G4IW56_9SACH|nr:LAME_0B06480g1_1 [Lachancea meyersii CBS 8951]